MCHIFSMSLLYKDEINLLPFNIYMRYSNPDELPQKELSSRCGKVSHPVAFKAPAPWREMISSN
tara:strand:- start:425 stop:616 length:192 start_codon:yes stop_codon:yes gene_type:complete